MRQFTKALIHYVCNFLYGLEVFWDSFCLGCFAERLSAGAAYMSTYNWGEHELWRKSFCEAVNKAELNVILRP